MNKTAGRFGFPIFFSILYILTSLTLSHAEPAADVTGPDRQRRSETGLAQLLRKARAGDLEAMCETGLSYFYGRDTLKDPSKARCWIQKAYGMGSDRAESIWNRLSLWQYPGDCQALLSEPSRSGYVKADVWEDPATGLGFVYLPRGCFDMGCRSKRCPKPQTPLHRVCLSGFWISSHEVSRGLWKRVMGRFPEGGSSEPDLPAANVSYHQVLDFISRLNQGADSGNHFFLPTEAQWEYACTGGRDNAFPWEETDLPRPRANCGDCENLGFSGRAAPVGSFPPGRLGLYDMGGNVKEWCKDIYHRKAYQFHDRHNPEYTGKGAARVVRGGSFLDNANRLGCRVRQGLIPSMRSRDLGFRLVLIRR